MTVNWKLHKIDNIYRMTYIFIHRIHVVLQFFCTWNLLMPLSNENTGHLGSLKPLFCRSWCATLIPQDVPKRLRASSLSFKQFCDQARFLSAEMRLEENHIEKSGYISFFVIYQICIAYYFFQWYLTWFSLLYSANVELVSVDSLLHS